MKKENAFNFILALAIVLLLGAVAFSVRIRPTSDWVAVVKAEGIGSSSSVAHLERALQSQKGVAAVEINNYEGWVVVGYDSKVLELERIASAIAEMGYAVRAAEAVSIDRFRAMTGRVPGTEFGSAGCGGVCAR